MEYQQLDNYGKIFTGKMSPKVLMAALTSVPKELGFIRTPKFLTKIQGKEKHWEGRLAEIAEPRGVSHPEYIEGGEYSLAFFSALVAARGEEKALDAYEKLLDRVAVMSFEEFFPSAKDFRRCPNDWEALQGYFKGLASGQ
jgi:hypothetical protein